MRIEKKLWIFYYWPIFECVRIFFTQTLDSKVMEILSILFSGCGKCKPCRRPDCGSCPQCLQMKKFGGDTDDSLLICYRQVK